MKIFYVIMLLILTSIGLSAKTITYRCELEDRNKILLFFLGSKYGGLKVESLTKDSNNTIDAELDGYGNLTIEDTFKYALPDSSFEKTVCDSLIKEYKNNIDKKISSGEYNKTYINLQKNQYVESQLSWHRSGEVSAIEINLYIKE